MQRQRRMLPALLSAALVVCIALLIEERSGLLRVGDSAPDFAGVAQTGQQLSLRDYRGKRNVVLFFYPGDFTTGCTKEACSFRDNRARIRELDGALLGVSHDSISSHDAFASRYNLPFPLLSDPDGSIRRGYGVLRLGGQIPLTKRVTYVIDRQGIIRAVIHHELFMNSHIQDALAALEEMYRGR